MRKDAIRETLTGLGVILSLLFVAMEIRANTDAVRGATMQGITEQAVSSLMTAATIPEFRSGVVKASAGDLEELSSDEETVLGISYAAALISAENRFRQSQLGLLDGTSILGGEGGTYANPFFGAYWEANRARYPSDFAAHVEANLLPLVRDRTPMPLAR